MPAAPQSIGRPVYIVDAVRTPIGQGRNDQGKLHNVHPVTLLAHVLDSLAQRNGLNKAEVEDVIAGCVTPLGDQGGNIPRLAALKAGYPVSVPGVQINRMCGSAQQAIHFASQAIGSGDMECVVACGVEMMSRVKMGADVNPELFQLGHKQNELSFGPFPHKLIHQGVSAELIAEHYKLNRAELDAFAIESHRRAHEATREGRFKSQIAPVKLADGAWVTEDEGVRWPVDADKLGALKPVFKKDGGVVTAGNASQVSDGAAAVLLCSEEKLKQLGLKARARIVARVAIGVDPVMMLDGVIPATRKVLEKAGMSIDQIDVFEVNEAFASVVMAWIKTLGVPHDKVNPNGGAIAHGHPLGATGAVLCAKLLNELERTGKRFGLQTMCIGHGAATATIIENLSAKPKM